MRINQTPPWEGRIGGLTADEIAEFLSAPWNGRLAWIALMLSSAVGGSGSEKSGCPELPWRMSVT